MFQHSFMLKRNKEQCGVLQKYLVLVIMFQNEKDTCPKGSQRFGPNLINHLGC